MLLQPAYPCPPTFIHQAKGYLCKPKLETEWTSTAYDSLHESCHGSFLPTQALCLTGAVKNGPSMGISRYFANF